MKKITSSILLSLFAFAVVATVPSTSNASEHQVDSFVCPVFNSDSVGEHNPNAVEIGGGDFTVTGPDVSVPTGATNDDGAGSPGGAHATPGDAGYTAIWAK